MKNALLGCALLVLLLMAMYWFTRELDGAVIMMQEQCADSGGTFTDHCERKK